MTFGHLEVSRNDKTPSQKYLKETKVYNEKRRTFLLLVSEKRRGPEETELNGPTTTENEPPGYCRLGVNLPRSAPL